VDFLDRFEKAAKAGFKGVEYLFPYAWKKEQLVEKLGAFGLVQTLHNLPAGDWNKGERGIACLPGREIEFQEGVGKAIEYAKALKCPQVNCLAGLTPAGVPADKVRQTLVANLRFAAAALEKEGIRLLVEALNDKDVPGFYLVRTADVLGLIKEVGHPNVYAQYDVYHMQIMEETSSRPSRPTSTGLPISRSPTTPAATSPAPARSTTPISSRPSMRPATRGGSDASTSPPRRPRTDSDG